MTLPLVAHEPCCTRHPSRYPVIRWQHHRIFVVCNLDTDGDTVRAIEVNPYAPAVVFRNPRTGEAVCGILLTVETETGKIKVAVGPTLYTICRHLIELVQY